MPKSPEKCKEIREETRNRILRESTLYFARNGFAQTKISDLAKYIGIGQGTMYQYFSSKEELFEEIGRQVNNEEEVKQIKTLALLPIPAKKKIGLLIEDVLKSFQEDELYGAKVTLNTQLIMEAEQYNSEKSMYQTGLYQNTAKIIKQGQREGTVVKKDPMELTDFFWSVIYVYALKSLFSSSFKMIDESELRRILLIEP